MREITFSQAVCEATAQCMERDKNVYIMGLGVPDPGAIFGTTQGLLEKFGAERVLDMPIAENGMTGIAIGSALTGMRPIMTHQRVDFMILAMEQLVNQAAKWHYTFDGSMNVPLVVRNIIGRGWGQGPQHMQSLYSWFAHIPGLKVLAPFSPYDAKGLLAAAVEDNNPVIIFEHRWLHHIHGHVPEDYYTVPIGKAQIVKSGADATILALSHMVLEALQAAQALSELGVEVEIVDIRSLRPLDTNTILESVRRTGRVVVADPDWASCGFSAELISVVSENAFSSLKAAPVRITLPDYPLPVSTALSEEYYPGAEDIVKAVLKTLQKELPPDWNGIQKAQRHDVPNKKFVGPF